MDSMTKRSIGSFRRRILLGAMVLLAGAIAYPQTSAAKGEPKKPKGALYVANGTNVLAFNLDHFKKGTHNVKPDLTLSSATGFGNVQGVVFDAALKNLWVIDGGNTSVGGTAAPAVEKFPYSVFFKLKHKKFPPLPKIRIFFSGFVFPQQAAFDAPGNLWVSDSGANAIYGFNPAQLAAGGAQTPLSITSSSLFPFRIPRGMAFDSSGNLLVANSGDDSIFKFNASTLPSPATTTGVVALTPNVILSDNGANSIQAPWGLGLDGAGSLWSSNANPPSTVVKFAKTDLGVTGSPDPAVKLSPTTDSMGNTTLTAPNGIAFDNLGNLVVINSATPFSIAYFSTGQLTTGGALVPNTLLVGNNTTLNAPAGCTVGPSVK